MKTETMKFEYKGKSYDVFVTFKFQRNINLRIKKDGFHVSAPSLTSRKKVIEMVEKYAPKLIDKFGESFSHFSFEDDYVYVLGEKQKLSELGISNEADLNNFIKEKARVIITDIVRKYEKIMSIEAPYTVKVRKTSSRYGSNSIATHSLSFQIDLIHYSEDIISTVVVHELAHDKHRNHQKGFYDCVYLYCPDYKILQNKLKRGIHK